MTKRQIQEHLKSDPHSGNDGAWLRDLILGGQDGLVNVLGLVLGVAIATNDARLVIVSGLAALFAEGISMGAVAYTSTKAAVEFYERERAREYNEIDTLPDAEKEEVRKIYQQKGFRGKMLEMIVQKITQNKNRWVNVMMEEELRLFKEKESPLRSGLIVGIAAHVGAVFPLIPFLLLPIDSAKIVVLPFSLLVLFVAGAIKGRFTRVTWWKSGLELAVIGIGSAIAGYVIGTLLGAAPGV